MLLRIKSVHQQFALGLRWLIASRDEIDYLKDRENLSYGFVNPIDPKVKSPYKAAVLTSNDYEKAVSIAGILSEKYQDLILVHKIQRNNYWVCVIKNHKIWNELDLRGHTAGDFICDKKNAKEIIELAQQAFSEEGIATEETTFSTNSAQEAFPDLAEINLTDMLEGCKKYYPKYKIGWLQSYKKKIKRLIVITSILVASIIGIFYIYSSQNAAARERARELKMQQEQQRKAEEKALYFRNLIQNIHKTHANQSIHQLMNLLNKLKMQSFGWEITNIQYDTKMNNQLNVELARTEFGDILSFKKAYKNNQVSEKISNDNNHGNKTLSFGEPIPSLTPDKEKAAIITGILANNEPEERYKFIATAQKEKLNFQTVAVKKQQYGFMSSDYTISGSGLWNLRKVEILMKQFPSATVDSVDIGVKDNQISWKIKGTLYD